MDIKSPEYLELEQMHNEKEYQFNKMKECLSRMEKMFGGVDQMSDEEILSLFVNKKQN